MEENNNIQEEQNNNAQIEQTNNMQEINNNNIQPSNETKPKNYIKLLIIIGVIALLAGILVGYFETKESNKEKETQENDKKENAAIIENDKEASDLYDKYINFSIEESMHNNNVTIDNSATYMTALAINSILEEKNIDIYNNESNEDIKDGVYVLNESLVTNKIQEIFGESIKIDYKNIFDEEYDKRIEEFDVDKMQKTIEEQQLDTSLSEELFFEYPSVNVKFFNITYKGNTKEFLVYTNVAGTDSTYEYIYKVTNIERTDNQLIIYDDYSMRVEYAGCTSYFDENDDSSTTAKEKSYSWDDEEEELNKINNYFENRQFDKLPVVGHYKHTFTKVNDKYVWTSTQKVQ